VIRNTSQQTNDTAPSTLTLEPGRYVKEDTTITGIALRTSAAAAQRSGITWRLDEAIYMDDQVSGVTMSNNVVESDGADVPLPRCVSNTATNNVVILQPAPSTMRLQRLTTHQGHELNGETRVDLLPSYSHRAWRLRRCGRALRQASAARGSIQRGADAWLSVPGRHGPVSDFLFTAQLAPHRGTASRSRSPMAPRQERDCDARQPCLFVNNTAVQLVAPRQRATTGPMDSSWAGQPGGDQILLQHNIVYRNGARLRSVDWSDGGRISIQPRRDRRQRALPELARAGDTVIGAQGADAHSLLANPGSPMHSGDYTLQPNSPALALALTRAAFAGA